MTDPAVLDACAAGAISPEIALARLLLGGTAPDPDALARIAARRPALAPLAALARRHRDRLEPLSALARTNLMPDGDTAEATAALFDRLAAAAPEAGVAFYAFGDAAALAAATAELAGVVRRWAPPAGRRVIDFGCGIGRLALALADEAADVLGLDLSAGMVAEAVARAGGRPQVRFWRNDGVALPVADGAADLVVAADSLPYVVRAGTAAAFVAEAARALAPGGDLLVFNWSYRGDPDRDAADAHALAAAYGLVVVRAGERPFAIWDAAGFHLRRPA